ncbi:MAG: hypothetical protein KatS3mg068_0027 [Candidatus Sericytochromatia bacterium]|nr:MAG: hypothetical protein KatS3mg068_0027 [Candidatus Sericytochromatia bacterium]
MNNIKKNYSNYNLDSDNYLEDIKNYPKDSYVKNNTNSSIGKLDKYSKEKENFNNEKSKIILKESNIDKTLDDLIPSQIGDAIDNVFSSVDNLLTKAGKLMFGHMKNKKVNSIPKKNNIVVNNPVKTVSSRNINTNTNNQLKVITEANTNNKSENNQKLEKTEQKQEIKKSPPITRTTSISELDLPLDILSDSDLVKYFDQMKLYDKKIEGGLCSLTFSEAEEILKKGKWGKLFTIKYEQLKINTMIAGSDAPLKRFNGMLPVYKALARKFKNTEELKKAIERDIETYLRTGEGSKDFHKFTYTLKK